MNKNVPRLRFKEFEGQWQLVKLKEITEEIKRTTEEKVDNILTISAGNGFLNQKERFSQVIAGSSLKKYTLLYKNEFSYNRGNSKKFKYGCVYKLEEHEKALVPNVYISFKFKNQNEEFYQQIFLKKYLDRHLRKLISSSARMDGLLNINKGDFFEIKVPVPSLQEQEKIADFFTILDSLIEEQDGKVSDLELYKKGMMQKIFSQEIRFKDENGCEYPEWDESILGEVSDVRDGTHESPKYVDKGYPLITSKNLIEDGSIDYSNVNYITHDDYISINKRSEVKSGDILFGMIGTIGNPVLVDREGFAIKNVALIKEQGKLKNSYLLPYLNSSLIEKQFYKVNAGGTQKFIALNLIRSLIIKTPSLEEQEKIAKFLVAIDNIIMNEKKNLDDLREVKKGLLQQMFV